MYNYNDSLALKMIIIFVFPLSFVQRISYYPSFFFWKTPLQGAQTSIYCAVSEEMEGVTGKYLADCKIEKLTNQQASDDRLAEELWEASVKMVGLQ